MDAFFNMIGELFTALFGFLEAAVNAFFPGFFTMGTRVAEIGGQSETGQLIVAFGSPIAMIGGSGFAILLAMGIRDMLSGGGEAAKNITMMGVNVTDIFTAPARIFEARFASQTAIAKANVNKTTITMEGSDGGKISFIGEGDKGVEAIESVAAKLPPIATSQVYSPKRALTGPPQPAPKKRSGVLSKIGVGGP